jgi:hypothetical protein
MSGFTPQYSPFMYLWLIVGELHHLPSYGVVWRVLLMPLGLLQGVRVCCIGRSVCSDILNGFEPRTHYLEVEVLDEGDLV